MQEITEKSKHDVAVSVIIPVYNCEAYLNRCIQSIIRQTLCNIEILLIDDGSTDQSGVICDRWACTDGRIHVVHLQNGGPAHARNIGMDMACGRYLGFVDSDDYIDADMYRTMMDQAEKYAADVVLCGYLEEQQGQKLRENRIPLPADIRFGEQEIRNQILRGYYATINGAFTALWNKLYRTEMIRREGLRMDESLFRGEDYWFNFDVYEKISSLCAVDGCFYHYIQDNTGSLMHRYRDDQYELWVATRKKLIDRNQKLGFSIDWERFYEGFLTKTAVYIRYLYHTGDGRGATAIFEDSFYRQALEHDRMTARHIRLLNFCTRHGWYALSEIGYRCWSCLTRNANAR